MVLIRCLTIGIRNLRRRIGPTPYPLPATGTIHTKPYSQRVWGVREKCPQKDPRLGAAGPISTPPSSSRAPLSRRKGGRDPYPRRMLTSTISCPRCAAPVPCFTPGKRRALRLEADCPQCGSRFAVAATISRQSGARIALIGDTTPPFETPEVLQRRREELGEE